MRSLKLLNLIIYSTFWITLFAQEPQFSREDYLHSQTNFEPPITENLYRGRNLIFNCKNKHFACVSDFDFQECQQKRSKANEERKFLLPCAPLKTFTSQIECFKSHYYVIHNQTYKGFCLSQKDLD